MLIKAPSRTDLHAAYEAPGCAVCHLVARSERRYIDMTLYEHVTDVKWRAEVRAARGFCALHTREVLKVSRAALGTSLVAEDILKTLREVLPGAGSGGTFGRLRSALGGASGGELRPQRPCPICAYRDELGAVYVAALVDDVASDAGRAAYERSAGLCLPHLVAAQARGGAGWAAIQARQARAWEQLEHELAEYSRKNDYRYSGEEMTEAERSAWRRALLLLSGGTE